MKVVEFDPVKEETESRAQRVVWTTKALDKALGALEKGRRLKANPFYENDVKLLKADLVFKRTDEEIEEWKKCRDDIIYFVNKYCKLMTPEGVANVTLRDYQRDYLEHLMKNRLSIFLSCRQSGKTTTSALFILHYICFNIDKNTLVLGNKHRTATEILDKLKRIFIELPYFLRPGVNKWNESEIVLDNGCRCLAEATTINSGISFTFHCVLCDEFAHIAPNIVDKFYNNIFPTITAARARLMITSTQNGYNLFYRLYKAAEAGESEYAPFKVDWEQVPEWNSEKHCWEPRTESWHRLQVANLGSEENFNKQFGTNFDVGANTLISQRVLRDARTELVEFVPKDMYGVPHSEHWYWHPNIDPMNLGSEFLVLTIDLAEGLGQDYTVFSVYRLGDAGLECVGYFRCNVLNRDKFTESLIAFLSKWAPRNTIVSFEQNTYGDIFYHTLMNLADAYPTFDPDMLVRYYNDAGTTWKYGVKITPGNKSTHCILFKESYERGTIINVSTRFYTELTNFCDDGGRYRASFGHDDMVMSAVQLEYVKQTLQYKLLVQEYESANKKLNDRNWNPYTLFNDQSHIYYDENELINEKEITNLSRLRQQSY